MHECHNEILNDCSWFAEKHRNKNKTSGPHWSTIIRFPKLFDEAVRLQDLVSAYENDLVLLDINEKLEKAQARIAELEQERQLISVYERLPKEDGDYLILTFFDGIGDYYSIAQYIDGFFFDYDDNRINPDYWQSLPQLQKEKKCLPIKT